MPELTATLAELAVVAEACVNAAGAGASSASDDSLLEHQRALAGSARLIEIAAARLAAEIAHRSRRELGYRGLAQKRGSRTPEALVQSVTGVSSSTARRLVRVGMLVAEVAAHDADPASAVTEQWLVPLAKAAATGGISAEAVDVIRVGLGSPTNSVSVEALTAAAEVLAVEAATTTVDRLAARAREMRDDLDVAGVAEREEDRRQRRYLRLFPQLDGMTRITGLLDPESAAVLTSAIDVATSPRRGGPRFVRPEDVAAAALLVSDERTTEQIALDALVELVDVAVRAKVGGHLGTRRAAVSVLVTQHDLDRRTGVGFISGQTATISIASVERLACDSGLVPILFGDNGESLNLGRTQRLHNGRQRTAIEARDGGCIGLDCDKPASWSEVHHINEFGNGGSTDVADGVLLCRHHHMLVHNNGWRIERVGTRYWLIPPPGIWTDEQPIALQSKSPAVRRMLATA